MVNFTLFIDNFFKRPWYPTKTVLYITGLNHNCRLSCFRYISIRNRNDFSSAIHTIPAWKMRHSLSEISDQNRRFVSSKRSCLKWFMKINIASALFVFK